MRILPVCLDFFCISSQKRGEHFNLESETTTTKIYLLALRWVGAGKGSQKHVNTVQWMSHNIYYPLN